MKFLTDFTYRNLHGFARFPGDSTALNVLYSQPTVISQLFCATLTYEGEGRGARLVLYNMWTTPNLLCSVTSVLSSYRPNCHVPVLFTVCYLIILFV